MESGFVAITGRTGEAEILENCLSTSRAGDNVFKFKNCNRQSFSRAAVGAAIPKMGANLSLQLNRNISAHATVANVSRQCRVYLALVLRIVS